MLINDGSGFLVLHCRKWRSPYGKVRGVEPRSGWTFLSNHSHVLIALAKQPDLRVRDLAREVGITERAVAQILTDLEGAGVLRRRRHGRRNVYDIDPTINLRHSVESHRTVGDILRLAEH
jgi:DNA-binding transcriptional ArsR family regulator